MLTPNILFTFFSIFLVVSATMVVISKQPVFSLLFLVGSFLAAALILFLLECEFLAFLFIIIYVGAIAVLFLFAIMMLELKLHSLNKNTIKYLPVALIFGILILFPLLNQINLEFQDCVYVHNFHSNKYQNWYDIIDSVADVEVYGHIIYSYFVLQFLIAGLILLVVLLGVVFLTNSYHKEVREQSLFKQLSRSSKFFTY